MVTPDEQRQLQRKNAEADAGFWSDMSEMNQEQADGHKGLAAMAQKASVKSEAAAAEATARAEAAKERIAKIDRGESVSGGPWQANDARRHNYRFRMD